MEWIIYLSFIFLPILFIWIMLWAIEKKIPRNYETSVRRGQFRVEMWLSLRGDVLKFPIKTKLGAIRWQLCCEIADGGRFSVSYAGFGGNRTNDGLWMHCMCYWATGERTGCQHWDRECSETRWRRNYLVFIDKFDKLLVEASFIVIRNKLVLVKVSKCLVTNTLLSQPLWSVLAS